MDNLCQFLPQDRVAAFVEMKEPGRLQETLNAILGNEFVKKQTEITKMQKVKKGRSLNSNLSPHDFY